MKSNPLYEASHIIVYVDGPRNEQERGLVDQVIGVARTVTPEVRISPTNRGLGNSIIAGVTEVTEAYGRAIVLEDDLVVMPNFLSFMNQALDAFQDDLRILSVCGYSLKVRRPRGYVGDVYLGDRSSSWGWGTWKDRWEAVDWEVPTWNSLKTDRYRQKAFNRAGSDMYGMLKDCMEGRNRSWAIRFCYHQFLNGLWSVHPFRSLVDNEGFGADATNCRQKYSRFKIEPDTDSGEKTWHWKTDIQPDTCLLRQLHFYHSVPLRIYSRIRKILNV